MATDLTLRENRDIQGDILAGFKKDQMTLLFLTFEDESRARTWLQRLTPRIATTKQVAAFNRAFSDARKRSGGDPVSLKATWLAISFTYAGLEKLAGKVPGSSPKLPPPGDEGETTLTAFAQGPVTRAAHLGDTGDSSPERWVFGNHKQEQTIHAVLTIASDTVEDLQAELVAQREAAQQFKISIVFQQNAATLPGTRRGKEHFGFKDGVSEPGVRGFDEPDPLQPQWVKDHPGTRLIPAGEFVVGQPRVADKPSDLPPWAFNGSFHVVRRLGQDVPGWWAQVARMLKELKDKKAVPQETTVEWLAARIVGRWRSGTPVAKCPHADTPFNTVASDDNDITFRDDPDGLITPLYSHLRKTNPRDGLNIIPESEDPREKNPLAEDPFIDSRRIMRRGSPYGHPFDPASEGPGGPDAPRGLLFVSYQADLLDQFEFIQKSWIDNPDFPPGRKPETGRDPMVGRAGTINWQNGDIRLSFQQFVQTEGAVYAFAPSITTLMSLSEGRLADKPQPVQGRPVDTFLPVGDMQPKDGKSWYWAFRTVGPQQTFRVVSIANSRDHTDVQEKPDREITQWDSFEGITRLDCFVPFPDNQPDNGKRWYWLFHTVNNQQVYRVISIADGREHEDVRERPDTQLGAWQSLKGVTKVDFFLPVPDMQPEQGKGKSWYWVFHTVNGEQLYRLVSIADGPQHTDVQERTDRRISQWDSLAGIGRVSAVLPIPDMYRKNGLSYHWVFHQDQYRITTIADGTAHTDAIAVPDRPVTLWKSLTQNT
ncbi:Dyp-type peroxidase [Streptacidiphilus sp. EB129]|uniref:Dyp-type peroxidase n=1 Tax=Streptacidiphilus sp. EB129 TaxID=3156262 RepID=UPI00351535E1